MSIIDYYIELFIVEEQCKQINNTINYLKIDFYRFKFVFDSKLSKEVKFV